MQKYSGQQWCRDISERVPTVARQWPDSTRQGPTPRQSGLKDTGPAVRHVRHPRHLRHARHSDTRHSDTLRHDTRISTVQPPSDTGQTQARHLRHRRHQCQSTPLRHCFDTPRHYSDTSDTSDTQTHQGSSKVDPTDSTHPNSPDRPTARTAPDRPRQHPTAMPTPPDTTRHHPPAAHP